MKTSCPECRTEHIVNDESVPLEGLQVTCTQCQAVFNARRPNPSLPEPRSDDEWMLRQAGGNIFRFRELTTLQRWIVERKISRDDEISRTGIKWERLGNIAELATFFQVVEAAPPASTAPEPAYEQTVAPSAPVLPSSSAELKAEWAGANAGLPGAVENGGWSFIGDDANDDDDDDFPIVPPRRRRGLAVAGATVLLVGVAVVVGWRVFPNESLALVERARGVAFGPTDAGPEGGSEPEVESPSLSGASSDQDGGMSQSVPETAALPTGGGEETVETAEIAEDGEPDTAEKEEPEIVAPPDKSPKAAEGGGELSEKAAEGAGGASFDGLLARADRLRQSDRPRRALPLYEEALKMDPHDPDALCGMGWAYLDLGKVAAATATFLDVVKHNPRFSDAHLGLGESYRARDMKRDSVKHYRRYLELFPSGPEATVAKRWIGELE